MKHDKPISRCEGCGRTLFSTMTRCYKCRDEDVQNDVAGIPVSLEDMSVEAIDDLHRKEAEAAAPDLVNHPPHYTAAGIECIDAIQAALTPEEFRGFCKGNAMKYEWRERHKGGDQDLAKAAWYLNRLTSKP